MNREVGGDEAGAQLPALQRFEVPHQPTRLLSVRYSENRIIWPRELPDRQSLNIFQLACRLLRFRSQSS